MLKRIWCAGHEEALPTRKFGKIMSGTSNLCRECKAKAERLAKKRVDSPLTRGWNQRYWEGFYNASAILAKDKHKKRLAWIKFYEYRRRAALSYEAMRAQLEEVQTSE